MPRAAKLRGALTNISRGDLLVAAALLLVVGAGARTRADAGSALYGPDEHQPWDVHRYYVSPAESWLAGRGWVSDFRQNFIPAPLQGAFVALVKVAWPGASYGTMRGFQAALSVATILLAFFIGCQLKDRWVGLLAAGFLAFDSFVVYYVAILLAENNYLFLLFAFLGVLLAALRRDSTTLIAASGALLALASLAKPFPFSLGILIPIYLGLRHRSWRSLGQGLAFFAAFAALVAPWLVRNYLRYDALYPISSNGGTALAMSNFLALDSARWIWVESYDPQRIWEDPQIEAAFRGRLDRYGQLEWNARDRAYGRHALRYAAQHPGHFAHNYVIKLANLFRHEKATSRLAATSAGPYRTALVLLGLPGLLWFAVAERRRPAWIAAWITAYFLALQALFYVSVTGRVQLPVKVLLTFFAAYLAVQAVRSLRDLRSRHAVG